MSALDRTGGHTAESWGTGKANGRMTCVRREPPRGATASGSVRSLPSVSVVVPTYREAQNLPLLLERLDRLRCTSGLVLEAIVVDDDSRDGTDRVVAAIGWPWVRLIVRTDERGLSSAALAGMRAARHEVLVVMDADLSHPPEKIPDLLDALEAGADLALGSRYVTGGGTEDSWGALRLLNSRVATWLARPFTRVSDPMSGFFAMRRTTFERARDLDPIGYKIGLELIVKCGCADVREVPIHFASRVYGESKLTVAERIRYLEHVRRLLLYRWRKAGRTARPAAARREPGDR